MLFPTHPCHLLALGKLFSYGDPSSRSIPNIPACRRCVQACDLNLRTRNTSYNILWKEKYPSLIFRCAELSGRKKLHNSFSLFAYFYPHLNPQRTSRNFEKAYAPQKNKLVEGIRTNANGKRVPVKGKVGILTAWGPVWVPRRDLKPPGSQVEDRERICLKGKQTAWQSVPSGMQSPWQHFP